MLEKTQRAIKRKKALETSRTSSRSFPKGKHAQTPVRMGCPKRFVETREISRDGELLGFRRKKLKVEQRKTLVQALYNG